MFLQNQLKTKEEEIETIKNEAVQIKKRYRQLESQIKTRDTKLNDLQKQIETHTMRTPTPSQEDSDIALRLRELRGIIEELKKENSEQRLEISKLRKK
jgi:chromosome segregation ATPase